MLEVKALDLVFPADGVGDEGGILPALSQVSFTLDAGERLGIVGESGAGKSLLASAIINLVPPPGRITAGSVQFDGRDLLTLPAAELRQVRGRRIAVVFQDPMTTLNPVLTIGEQLTEGLHAHGLCGDKKEATEQAIARLREVAIPSPEQRINAYPHELSGGMRQRVVIASALITEPSLIIADEPTTALDVTTQAEIMHLLTELCRRRRMGLILITHDLSLLAQTTDSIMVMYAGRAVERGATAELIATPRHPYTQGLLQALGGRGDDGRFMQIRGNMPPLSQIPGGCAFHPRCRHAQQRCRDELPRLPLPSGERNAAACHFSDAIIAELR